jgi:hypothetical protein
LLKQVHMTLFRVLGAVALAGSLGCTGTLVSAGDGGSAEGGGGTDGGTSTDAADGGAGEGGACVTGSITFALHAAPGSSNRFCLGGPGSCSSEWLSIHPMGSSSALTIDAPCEAKCGDCQPVACTALCAAPNPLGPSGAQRMWDGTFFAQSSKCGATNSCYDTSCAPAGHYVATMCGYPNQGGDASIPPCSPGMTPTCVDVDFDWPPPAGSPDVSGTLGGSASDAGAG